MSQNVVTIQGKSLSICDVRDVSVGRKDVKLTTNRTILRKIKASAKFVAESVKNNDPIYGVTSNFGGLSNISISDLNSERLQKNLIWAHKAGTGEYLPLEDVRAAMVIRMNSLSKGASGVRIELISRLEKFINEGVTPLVPSLGSIGASGDLIPLSYIAGAITGLNSSYLVDFNKKKMTALSALKKLGLGPISLLPKEGLALINGTSVMAGVAVRCVSEFKGLFKLTLGAHALYCQGLYATDMSFASFIHQQKAHPGQLDIAKQMRRLLKGSQLIRNEQTGKDKRVGDELIQDRYSLRCLPQYLGPIVEGFEEITRQIEVEINSATDNPLIDVEEGKSYHGGNFLGQYVGVGMDRLRYFIGLIAKHLDVQIAQLVSPAFNNGLSASLVGNSDDPINVGVKSLQIAGNSILPLLTFYGNSIADRFPTHAEQFNQNINSQGFNSANLTSVAIDYFQNYLAIALLIGVQAVELRTKNIVNHFDARKSLSAVSLALYRAVCRVVGRTPTSNKPLIWNDSDRFFDSDISKLVDDLKSRKSLLDIV